VSLPTDAKARKDTPIFSGVVRYFPDALAAVAELSRIGNDQHNPGQPLHWDRSKSTDELDALMRHLVEAGTVDKDNVRHSTKVAWRALANLQKEIERAEAAPLSVVDMAKVVAAYAGADPSCSFCQGSGMIGDHLGSIGCSCVK
jgi:dATP/dGTP diphosphohydrolase